jgi:beta-galactosidase
VVWSCGNESGYGPNGQAVFDYMKANDPTRLALISQQGLNVNPKSDFDDYHYPAVTLMKEMLKSPNRAKVPAIYTEIGGIEDPWGRILADNWEPIWGSDGITGAFIWEWQEQNLLDRFPERWSTPSPGARGIDAKGIRLAGGGGAVTADRQIKPNRYYNLKMVYSPVTTAAREISPAAGKVVVPIQNRYSFTDLSELTCRWQAFAGDKELAHGVTKVAAKPRTTVDAPFPATAGMDTLRLEFIHPDGRSVYAARLHVKGYRGPAAPAALAAAGPVRLSETGQNVVVETAGTRLVLDKSTGQIASWRAGARDIVLAGPILNLGESIPGAAPRPGGRGTPPPPTITSAQAPQYRNPVVTAKMDGANARIDVTAGIYIAGSDELKGQLNYTLVVGPDAQADLTWNLSWKAADALAREAGLKFLLPTADDRMSWFADSFWTETPPDHIGNPHGSITSKDATFNSSRRDIHWAALSGAGNNGLVALSADKPLHTHAAAGDNGTTLSLSSAIASTGRDVTGDSIRLTQGTPLTGAFRLRAAAGSAK